ncbi:uncharacterized protein LOC117920820 [Vitis riparia]|uniref:uncharacterized protein LOC117920820 n=1 Tax=Vitis riparia TaxID=96939 RepID=UPI00155AB627|nr:uncharacterized protein LOC117920820 [Vitis riparia]
MSINFASLAGETSKKASPVLQKNRNSRINAIAAKITEESSTPRRTTIRASMSGYQSILQQQPLSQKIEGPELYLISQFLGTEQLKGNGSHSWQSDHNLQLHAEANQGLLLYFSV